MPINDFGYNLKTEIEYREDLINDTLAEFPEMSTNDANPLVVLLKSFSNEFADSDAYGQEAYNNVYVLTSEGVHLDAIVKIAGISRLDGTKAVADLKFIGNKDVPIRPNTVVESSDGLRFLTTNSTTIYIDTPVDSGDLSKGYFIVQQAVAEELGDEYNLVPNSLVNIVNPISGLMSVTNELGSLGGTAVETDAELRNRYFTAIEQSTGSSIKAIINNVYLSDNVVYAFGLENYTNEIDSNGLPPKSFNIIVEGGINEDIAQSIFEVKPAGIESFGSVRVDVPFGDNTYPIFFDRAIVTPIFYEIELSVDSNFFQQDYLDIIKENIINYTNDTLSIEKNRLIGLIYRDVDGVVSVDSMKFDRADPPINEDDLFVEEREKFTTDNVKIVINTSFV